MAGKTSGESADFGFQIAPMVDVVFVLLLFFMAVAAQNIREGFLTVPLPTGPGGGEAPIVLDIDAAGTVFVNGSAMSGETTDSDLVKLRQFLVTSMQAAPADPVLIRPSLEARHGRVVEVVDICRAVRVKKLCFL